MPRTKLDKMNELSGMTPNPRKYPPKQEPAIVADLAPAIVTFIPVSNTPSIRVTKKLAGTPFVVDVDTGLVYLEEKILKALRNN